jgi:hypothetical protein
MALSNLTQLIHGLKTGEVQLIRNYYSSMVTLKDATKRLQLFDIIKSDKKATDELASQKLYKCKPNSAYSQLKRRLKEDVLNILLLQDSKRRYNTPFARAEFDTRRMIIEGDILISRGLSLEGVKLLKDASFLAESYELFNELIMANELLLGHFPAYKSAKQYNAYLSKIKLGKSNLEKCLYAKECYHKVLIPNLFKLNQEKLFEKFAKEALVKLKTDFEETNSAKMGYYFYHISIAYNNLIKEYKSALKYAELFLKLNKESKVVHTKRAVAEAYYQISFINLQLKNYKVASLNAEKAISNLKSGLSNELTTLELLFLAHFYNNDAKKAEQVLQRALTHPKLNSNKFLPAKWHYYKACYLFKQKKFNEANDAMSNCTYLLEDKTGWLYGYRILDIMITLECNEAFLVDSKVANFKKIIGKQKNINSSRAKTTLKILDTLVKRHYEYKLIYKSQKANILTLQEAKETHLWEPIGYELIRFEEWILGKINSSRLGPLDIMVTGTSK